MDLSKKLLIAALWVSASVGANAQETKGLSFSANMCVNTFANGQIKGSEVMMGYCGASADNGDMISQAVLGQIYMHGVKDIEKDPEEAYHWTELAAEQGHVPSISELGRMKLLGYGTEKDSDGAKTLLDKAISLRSGSAAYYKSIWWLGEDLPGEYADMSFNEKMINVCTMNLVAIDYGYSDKKVAFNNLMMEIYKTSTKDGEMITSECNRKTLKFHQEHKSPFLYSRAGLPTKEFGKMPDGPYPITSPEFWLSIIAPRK